MEFLVLAFLGVVTGVIAALFGIGGGAIIVPAVLYGHYILPSFDFSMQDAVVISVIQMIFSSIFGSFLNIFIKKNLDLKDAMFLGVGGLIGASFSGMLVSSIDSKHLTLIFLIVILITFYKFVFGAKVDVKEKILKPFKKYAIIVLTGISTGIFAISLGIGGGLILTPLFVYFLGYNTKKIMPLSLFFVMCASISGTLSFSNNGILEYKVIHAGLVIGCFSIIGVLIGSRILDLISLKYHRIILMCLYSIAILATLNKVLVYYGIFNL